MKFLFLADLHIGQSSHSTEHPGVIRQANSQALENLAELIPVFNDAQVDLVVLMGDIIKETRDKAINEANFRDALSLLSQINPPLVNLVGNHDRYAFTVEELTALYNAFHLNSNFFGSQTIGDYQVIWLDFQINAEGKQCLSDVRLLWLEKTLDTDKKVMLLSHYSIVPQNAQGNFYFDQSPGYIYYANSDEILQVLNQRQVIIAVNAHAHWISYKKIGRINFITVPSFSENIAAARYPDNHPAIYTTLETSSSNFVIKSYSGAFCFFNLEI